jgi:hypothetical protein
MFLRVFTLMGLVCEEIINLLVISFAITITTDWSIVTGKLAMRLVLHQILTALNSLVVLLILLISLNLGNTVRSIS